MNGKTIAGLSIVTIVLLAIGFSLSSKEEPARNISGPEAAGSLFPQLVANVNDADRMVIVDKEGTVTLVRQDGEWALAEVANYPVKIEKVRDTMSKITAMKIAEKKTANPEYFEQLSLKEPASGEGAAREVRIYKGDETLAEVLLGKPENVAFDQPHQYVRKVGENQVWLVSGNATPQTWQNAWLDAELLKIANRRIEKVTFADDAGTSYTVSRTDSSTTNFALAPIPEGKQLKSENVTAEIAGIVSTLRFDDVKPRVDLDLNDENELSTTTIETFDGVELTATRYGLDDKTWLVFDASFDSERIDRTNAEREAVTKAANEALAQLEVPEGEESPAPAVPDLIDKEAIQKEVADLNAKFEKYAYTVQKYYDEKLSRAKDYYLKDEEKPAVEGPELPTENAMDTSMPAMGETLTP